MTLYISLFLLAWWVLSVCLFFFIPRLLFPFLFFFVFLNCTRDANKHARAEIFPILRHGPIGATWRVVDVFSWRPRQPDRGHQRLVIDLTSSTQTTRQRRNQTTLSLFLSAVAISMSTHKTTFSTNASKGLDVRRRHIGIDGPWNKMPVPTHPVKKIELDR